MNGYTKRKHAPVLRKVLITRYGTQTAVVVFRVNRRRVYYIDHMSGKSYLRLMRVLDSMEHEIEIDSDRLAIRYFPHKGG